MHIYIVKNGTKTGPYSEEQVRGMLTGGLVSVDDSAWHEGTVDWQPLHALLGFKQPPPIPTAVPPVVAQQAHVASGASSLVSQVITQTLKPAGANSTYSNVEILEIAKQQKTILWFIPISILGGSILAGLLGAIIDPEMVLVVVLAIGFTSVMFICQLALALKKSPWLYAILAMIPCISTIAILILNGRATSALKAQGIRVGLMGARKEDLDKINANTAIAPGGSYTVALKNAVPSTDQGDAEAQFNLGWRYANGPGVPKDEDEVVKRVRKAADQGEAMAQNSLGNCYFFGRGVANDEVEACKWYLLAAAQGHEHAKENFGILETRMTSTQRAEGQKRFREFKKK